MKNVYIMLTSTNNEAWRRSLEALVRSVSRSEIDMMAVGVIHVYSPHWPATNSLVPDKRNNTTMLYNGHVGRESI